MAARRHTHDGGSPCYIARHAGRCPDCDALAQFTTLKDDGTGADMAAGTYRDITRNHSAARHMHVRADSATVLNNAAGIDDDVVTDLHARLDDGACHDLYASAQPR